MKPSEFYKMRRPEYFSDSEIVNETILPREVLAYELSKISTNQKQDEFETLCRRLAEKLITPNLIPQVGPTGGGDGKTDFETYPVSKSISNRWFIPENGWENDEKWAFAISAKKDWKSKAKNDIKNIVETKRDYTLVYFITNQLVPSKKKKDTQDELKEEFDIEAIILDGEWILEKIYNNNLIEIAVDSLNLSSVYKNKKIKVGANDTQRLKELEEIEKNIANPNRYSEYDFQLVEDALKSAVLSRMLEKPRDEVEGKFDRVFRFCKKVNNSKQWVRIYYQRAWTYFNWYDDYPLYIENYKSLKTYISKDSSISDIELYFNLFNLLNALRNNKICNLSDYKIEIEKEEREILNVLTKIENDKKRPNSALTAKTFKVLIKLTYCIYQGEKPDNFFKELSNIILKCSQSLDFSFESTKQIIEELGNIFPNHTEYDILIDNVAKISEKRNSELASGEIFVRRGGQKLHAKYYKESIVYFGKAVMKLAKDETQKGMYLALLGLGMAYRELGLIWASNNCYTIACSISFKSIDKIGTVNKKAYQSIQGIISNELITGRIPSFFVWYEMYSILSRTFGIDENENNLTFTGLTDCCLSTRILHTDKAPKEALQYLPDLLEKLELYLSQNTALYKLGYTDNIINDYKDIGNEQELDDYFNKVANQPVVEQMLYQTNFMLGNKLYLSSNILGCKFLIKFTKDTEMLLVAETLLAFSEGFFATAMGELIAHTETITINLGRNKEDCNLAFTYNESTTEYDILVNNFNVTAENRSLAWKSILAFVTDILVRHFIAKDIEQYVVNLYEKEEIHERLSMIIDHRNSTFDLLGDTPKLFFDDWLTYLKPSEYISKREEPILYNKNIKKTNQQFQEKNVDTIRHDEVETHSVIDISLWDKAKWGGFGFLLDPKEGLGVIIAYENPDAGKKIFDKWINKFGHEDNDELIRITIIKGVNEHNPYWYRVHISTNINELNLLESNKYFTVASRIHEMKTDSPQNLNNLINLFHTMKKYKLYPAKISNDGENIEPYFNKGILKTTLTIKEAWEIGENDLDMVIINENDSPIIPESIKDAPVLKILNKAR